MTMNKKLFLGLFLIIATLMSANIAMAWFIKSDGFKMTHDGLREQQFLNKPKEVEHIPSPVKITKQYCYFTFEGITCEDLVIDQVESTLVHGKNRDITYRGGRVRSTVLLPNVMKGAPRNFFS